MQLLTGAIRSATQARSAARLAAGASKSSLAGRPAGALLGRTYASHSHEEESAEGFTSRYVNFFSSVQDLFELQRGLNNCFAYDLVPSPEIIEAALRASRRVNDYPTAVRIYEGVREKCENDKQYQQYVEALKPVKDELGISLKEELYSA